MRVTLELDGQTHDLALTKAREAKDGWSIEAGDDMLVARLERNGTGTLVRIGDRTFHIELGPDGQARIDGKPAKYVVHTVSGSAVAGVAGQARTTHVRPPMNGKLERLFVQPGQTVAKGDVLFVLEAMKMHNEVKAPVAGRVAAVHLAAGATVEPRQVVLDLEPA